VFVKAEVLVTVLPLDTDPDREEHELLKSEAEAQELQVEESRLLEKVGCGPGVKVEVARLPLAKQVP
jgi:hypothetical protein